MVLLRLCKGFQRVISYLPISFLLDIIILPVFHISNTAKRIMDFHSSEVFPYPSSNCFEFSIDKSDRQSLISTQIQLLAGADETQQISALELLSQMLLQCFPWSFLSQFQSLHFNLDNDAPQIMQASGLFLYLPSLLSSSTSNVLYVWNILLDPNLVYYTMPRAKPPISYCSSSSQHHNLVDSKHLHSFLQLYRLWLTFVP